MAKDEKEQGFEVTVSGPGVAIKLPVVPNVANRVIAIIMGGAFDSGHADPKDLASGNSTGDATSGASRSARGKTAREALNEAQAKRSFDKITAIGAMLMDSGAESFTADEVRAQFKRASEALPGNFNRDMRSALRTGWIAHDQDNADAYYVTQAGRDAIAGKFTGEARVTVSRAKQKSRRSKKADE